MTERPSQRLVGGLWCRDVLARLPDYIDGTLGPRERAATEAHLAGCDWCARFGGQYTAAVSAIQRELRRADPVSQDVADRLAERLARELG